MDRKRVHLRFDKNHGEHSKVTLFFRGSNCGQLTLRQDEAIWLQRIIDKGCEVLRFNFLASGKNPNPDSKLIDDCANELSER